MPIDNVGDAIREFKRGSKHIRSLKQAQAVGLKAEREAGHMKKRKKRGRKAKRKNPRY